MFAYCNNNPVTTSDPKGDVRVAILYDSKLFQKKPFGIAGLFLDLTLRMSSIGTYSPTAVDSYGFKTVDEFVSAWNSLDGEYDEIYIYAHGSDGIAGIYTGNGYIRYSPGKNDVSFSELKNVTVNRHVHLYTCYGSQKDSDGHSAAQGFADLTNAPVYSTDGVQGTFWLFGITFAWKCEWTTTYPSRRPSRHSHTTHSVTEQ